MTTPDPGGRWAAERAFFDARARASREGLAPFDDRVMVRYARWRRLHFNKEFRFRLLGDLRGRRVLDVGCGDGTNAVILARLGAQVTGIDLSPESIALAGERAAVNDVAPRVRLHCTAVEAFAPGDAMFDVVWCDAFLHHVLPTLHETMARLLRWLRPGGIFIAAEPVRLARWLDRIRRLARTVPDIGTPDERPVRSGELREVLERHPWLRVRYFRLLGRADRLVLRGRVMEDATWPRRLAIESLARLDQLALAPPSPVRRLASVVVLHGHRP